MTTKDTPAKTILNMLKKKYNWCNNPEFFPVFQAFLESIVVNERLHVQYKWPMVVMHIHNIIIIILNDIKHDVFWSSIKEVISHKIQQLDAYKTRDVLKHLLNCMDTLRIQIIDWSKTYEPADRHYNACISSMIDYFENMKYYIKEAYTQTNVDNLELITIKTKVNEILFHSSISYRIVYDMCSNSNVYLFWFKPLF
jgi:hypothetical protein